MKTTPQKNKKIRRPQKEWKCRRPQKNKENKDGHKKNPQKSTLIAGDIIVN